VWEVCASCVYTSMCASIVRRCCLVFANLLDTCLQAWMNNCHFARLTVFKAYPVVRTHTPANTHAYTLNHTNNRMRYNSAQTHANYIRTVQLPRGCMTGLCGSCTCDIEEPLVGAENGFRAIARACSMPVSSCVRT